MLLYLHTESSIGMIHVPVAQMVEHFHRKWLRFHIESVQGHREKGVVGLGETPILYDLVPLL